MDTYRVNDVITDLGLRRNELNIIYATTLLNVFNFYLHSEYMRIDDMPLSTLFKSWSHFGKDMPADLNRLFKLQKNVNNHVGVSHDLYMKLFQLSKPKLDYDYIFVDEAQDLNGAIIDVIQNQDAKLMLVGDSYQQIYGFRLSIDALNQFDGFKNYALTNSFRFGPETAELAKKVLSIGYRTPQIFGLNKQQNIDKITKYPYAYLCRSNAGIFDILIQFMSKGTKIAFEGGKNSYNFSLIRDVYALYNDEPQLVKNPQLKMFRDWYELETFLNTSGDRELSAAVNIVDKYKDDIPKYLHEIHKLPDIPKENAEIILSTVHKAKGMEYDQVKLHNDFAEIGYLNKVISETEGDYIAGQTLEEINLLYVAATRSKHKLELNEDLEKLRSKEYQIIDNTTNFKRRNVVEEINEVELAKYHFLKQKHSKTSNIKNKNNVKITTVDNKIKINNPTVVPNNRMSSYDFIKQYIKNN
ncbi:3'-5' exonuclease [Defluviitoga tunisiensis]|uniref:DNA 3'-5' helicase n=1 Tax=Defluviitoga tunisiensis TaxID=1006576 RepID=A0A0C7NM35_DEFTU|nr:3'-5' exonuclease [Defluviitoga tunisiensis]CEP78961.1 putative DNA helicase uvrD [Defluviitoga tunisiensis]